MFVQVTVVYSECSHGDISDMVFIVCIEVFIVSKTLDLGASSKGVHSPFVF